MHLLLGKANSFKQQASHSSALNQQEHMHVRTQGEKTKISLNVHQSLPTSKSLLHGNKACV